MTQKEAMRNVVAFMNSALKGYGLKPDQITGKTFAVVKTTNGLDAVATISNYYKPTELLIWINGFIGCRAFDSLEHTND